MEEEETIMLLFLFLGGNDIMASAQDIYEDRIKNSPDAIRSFLLHFTPRAYNVSSESKMKEKGMVVSLRCVVSITYYLERHQKTGLGATHSSMGLGSEKNWSSSRHKTILFRPTLHRRVESVIDWAFGGA